MPTTKQLYKFFIRDHWARLCWACARSGGFGSRPAGWFGPFGLDRAHIVSQPRVEDPRAIVILCSLCHKTYHGERIILDGETEPRPQLHRAHLIFLKRVWDRENYDRKFLQMCCVGKLPHAHKLPAFYIAEFRRRQAA